MASRSSLARTVDTRRGSPPTMKSNSSKTPETGMSRTVYVNGDYVPLEEARIPIMDRGFLFADGIYEVSAVINGKLVDNGLHMERLLRSTREIGLALPETPQRIEAIQKELIRLNALEEGVVYLQVTRGVAEREFAFPADAQPTLILFTQARSLVHSPTGLSGMKVKSVPDLRWMRRDIKSVGLLAQVLAKQAAVEAGCQEAWMVQDGLVTEGASSTAYVITMDGVLITRARSSMTLPGCTRLAIQDLVAEAGLRLEERAFSLDEALAAREAFITSAGYLVAPVVEIDGTPIGNGRPGGATQRLRQLYVERANAMD